MNKKMKNRVMNHSTKFNQQQGVSTLLFTVLVGVSLTALSVGYISSLKTVQNSATTLHAQTQAQMQSMIGLNALNKFLSEQPLSNIEQIKSGNIKTAGVETIKFEMVSSNAGNFVFDITGTSGDASSIVRAIYASKTTGGGSFDGSIFAGGLQIGQTRNLKGDQTILVGGRENGEIWGNGSAVYTSDDFFENSKYEDGTGGIKTGVYTPTRFITAEELRPSANYIFYANGKCAKNNLTGANIYNIETDPPVACNDISGITSSGSGDNKKWTIDAASSVIPVGVLWFEGNVDINLKSSRDLVNTIIATGEMQVITTNQGGAGRAYAPYHFYLESNANSETKKARICGSSSTGIPTQYCDNTGTLKALDTEKARIANLLFLSDKNIIFEVKNNSPMSLYGNIMGSGGAGGTGASSGKFNGAGNIDIKGNVTFTGIGKTTTNGNVHVTLKKSGNNSGEVIPNRTVMTLSSLRYM